MRTPCAPTHQQKSHHHYTVLSAGKVFLASFLFIPDIMMNAMSVIQTPLRRVCCPRVKPTSRRNRICSSVVQDFQTKETTKNVKIRSKPVIPSWIEKQLAEEDLDSTPKQQILVAGSFGVNFFLLSRGVMQVSSLEELISGCFVFIGGFLIADLLSGVYHWGIDNYGSKQTPVFGNQIEGFQRHHRYPWTITYRQFCNNVSPICLPAIIFSSIIASSQLHPLVDVFCSSGCIFVVLCQQFHAWAHTKPKDLSPWVLRLQKIGILVSTGMHCRHHREPFDTNYCIVSGTWNPLLDQIQFFNSLEKVIHEFTGVIPRSWAEQDGNQREVEEEEISYFAD